MIRMLTSFKRPIGTFNKFVKILRASPSPKHRQRNSYRLPDHWNLRNFWEFLLRGTEKHVSLRSILLANPPALEVISDNADLPIWNAHMEWICWDFQNLSLGGSLHPFFSTKKRWLRNCPCMGTTFWIAHFSNISSTSCSTNENCSFDIFVKFGISSWNGKFTNGISYAFTKDNISWSWVIFSQAIMK